MELLLHPHGLAVLATFPDFLHLSGVPSHKLTQFTLNNRVSMYLGFYQSGVQNLGPPIDVWTN